MSNSTVLKTKPLAIVTTGKQIDKRWGHELIYINGEYSDTEGENRYCMKRIYIKDGAESSMHFHINKHETLYVASGTLELVYNDGLGDQHILHVSPGTAVIVPPGFQHKLRALKGLGDLVIIEASTPDSPGDSFRVGM